MEELDTKAIAAQVDAVLGEALYWFPVRHHSPSVARFAVRAIRERRPKLLFLEAPSEVSPLLVHVADAETRPPVALYSSFRDDHGVLGIPRAKDDLPAQIASFYPMTGYSPEYAAIVAAHEVGCEIVCMDLPHWALVRREGDEPPRPEKHGEDELLPASDFVHRLASAAGHRTWNETWDTLFESPGDDLERHRRELAAFCAAARATTPRERIETDGTIPRERFMWRTIERTLAERGLGAREAMVLCGGFHLFMERDGIDPPPIPEGTVHTALVPYSYPRIWERSGYGAGNRAPQFYQHLYEGLSRGTPIEEVLAEHAITVLRAARKSGERLAAADAIAVVHHTKLLAQLRGRAAPVLDDLHDALVTCCVKGDPRTDGEGLRKAITECDVGTRLGRVTSAAGQLPLVKDYYAAIDRLELTELREHEKVFHLTLDKREPLDADRSKNLHRLLYLGVPIGEVRRDGDPFGHALFKERWKLTWSPKIEDALVERSLDGDTIEAAALHQLARALATSEHDAGRACRELVHAIDMDLPQMIAHVEAAAGAAIDTDGRFVSLTVALNHLAVLERYAAYRELRRRELGELLTRCYDRACFAVTEVAAAPPEEHAAVATGLSTLAEMVLTRDDLDAVLFASNVEAAVRVSTVAELRGAFLGILVEVRRVDVARIADELTAYAGGSPERQLEAGDFLHGVLSVSKTAVMVGARALVTAIDSVLDAVDREVFLAMAPRVRAAVEQLHPRHRDALAREVAALHGVREDHVTEALSTSAEAAALIAEIDAEVRAIMNDWSLA